MQEEVDKAEGLASEPKLDVSSIVELPVEKEIVLITDPAERLLALQEIEVLGGLLNTSYYMPRYSGGMKKTAKSEIVSSIKLNYFGFQQMQLWGNRICELTDKLGILPEAK